MPATSAAPFSEWTTHHPTHHPTHLGLVWDSIWSMSSLDFSLRVARRMDFWTGRKNPFIPEAPERAARCAACVFVDADPTVSGPRGWACSCPKQEH